MDELDTFITSALADLDPTYASDDPASSEAVTATTDEPASESEPVDDEDAEETDAVDDGEGDEAEADAESEDTAVAVDEDTIITLPDGTTMSVKDGLERKADYTRKTQELAAQRKQVEDEFTRLTAWRDSVVQAPAAFVQELVSEKLVNPSKLASDVLASQADPTAALAAAISELLTAGKLDPTFVKAFGLEAPEHVVHGKAAKQAENERLEQLEARLAEREAAESASRAQAQAAAAYEQQIANIVRTEGLTDPDALIVELIPFARERGLIDNLEVAFAVMQHERSKSAAATQAKQAAVTAKKRKTSAVTPRGATPSKAPAVGRKSYDTETAAAEALAELLARSK